MLENERTVKARKKNMKLYPIYRMIGSDIIFLYAIKMLFLTQVKGIKPQDIVMSVSIYAFFMIVLQVPITVLIEKVGYKKSAFMSNVFNVIYITLLMCSTNIWWLIIAEFTSAISFSLKDVAEPSLLNTSIPETEKRGNIYSKLEGRGNSKYNFLNGIANIMAGVLYVVNPYLPIIFALSCALIACIISLQFEEVNKKAEKNEANNYIKDMLVSFQFIFHSKRLKCLLIYAGLIWGVHCLVSEYKDTLLVEIETSALLIGIVGAILEIVASIAAKKQGKFHDRFKNKSLSYIAISFALGIVISGGIALFKTPFIIELIVIVMAFGIEVADKSMSLILINRYLANFSNEDILPKIYAANSIVKNLFRMVIGILGSILMTKTGTAGAMTIVGVSLLIIVVILLKIMKTRVGLKPEEYKKEEIEFSGLH